MMTEFTSPLPTDSTDAKRSIGERIIVVDELLSAHKANRLRSFLLVHSVPGLFGLCIIGYLITLLWALAQDGYASVLISGFLLWLVVLPLAGIVVQSRLGAEVRKLLTKRESIEKIPGSKEEWDALITVRQTRCLPKLGVKVVDEPTAMLEWNSIVSDCHRINSQLPPEKQIVLSKQGADAIPVAVVAFQVILVLSIFIPPVLHSEMSALVRGKPADSAPKVANRERPEVTPPAQSKRPPPPPLSEGFSVPPETRSPHGEYGVLVSNHANFKEGARGQNALIDLGSGRIIAAIDGESCFLDPVISMDHGGISATWSKDSMCLAWVVKGKWGPRAFNLLRLSDSGLLWQIDVLSATRNELLRRTKAFAAEGVPFPRDDEFVLDVEILPVHFDFPINIGASLDSNPKGIPELNSVKTSIIATVNYQGNLEFRDFTPIALGRKHVLDQSPATIKEFVIRKVEADKSHDLDRIMRLYADRVIFWENGTVDQTFIRKAKESYFSKWPETSEEILDGVKVARSGVDWAASFRARFSVNNPSTGTSIQGIQETIYTVRQENGRCQIISETGRVIERKQLLASNADPFPGERFPESRTRMMDSGKINSMTQDNVRYAINELFARHGAWLAKDDVRAEFERLPWYKPQKGVSLDEIEKRFTDIEKANLDALAAYRARFTPGGRPAAVDSDAGKSGRTGKKSVPPGRPSGKGSDTEFDDLDRY
jgi:hypothetical protein